MSNLAEIPYITVDDYLAGEAESPVKHEYKDVSFESAEGAAPQPDD